MNTISSWSIRHPVPTIVLFIALALVGIFGFTQLRINSMPDIDIPTVIVTVTQSGASPSELETQVTQVIENAVVGLDGVDTVTSTISEGASTTSVDFTLGTDSESATNDVRNAVSTVAGDLPAGRRGAHRFAGQRDVERRHHLCCRGAGHVYPTSSAGSSTTMSARPCSRSTASRRSPARAGSIASSPSSSIPTASPPSASR